MIIFHDPILSVAIFTNQFQIMKFGSERRALEIKCIINRNIVNISL